MTVYVIQNGKKYVGLDVRTNRATTVGSLDRALTFTEKVKAINFLNNLSATMRRFPWEVCAVQQSAIRNKDYSSIASCEETNLERANIDILHQIKIIASTFSELEDYSQNMRLKEKEKTEQIQDVKHYVRDVNTRLNAVQMQRIGYFWQKLERERWEYKRSRLIAEYVLTHIDRLEEKDFVSEMCKHVAAPYEPRILTFDVLDEIAGVKKSEKKGVVA